MEYRKATVEDLNKIWDKDIARKSGDEGWVRLKKQYMDYNANGEAATFVAVNKGEPIGQITVLLSQNCKAVKDKPLLCDGKTIANMNAFRIDKSFEGQGHISKLVKMAEQYAKNLGFKSLSIGAEACESRNLAIYLHFGYTHFLMSEIWKEENNSLVLYYKKDLI